MVSTKIIYNKKLEVNCNWLIIAAETEILIFSSMIGRLFHKHGNRLK